MKIWTLFLDKHMDHPSAFNFRGSMGSPKSFYKLLVNTLRLILHETTYFHIKFIFKKKPSLPSLLLRLFDASFFLSH